MVGSLGSDLVTLAKLSLYIARFNFHTVDCSNMKVFDESMRGLFRLSGLEGQPTGTVFTVSIWEIGDLSCVILYHCILQADDIENKLILETLNSILAIGDVPTLFSNDEVDGLLEVIICHVRSYWSCDCCIVLGTGAINQERFSKPSCQCNGLLHFPYEKKSTQCRLLPSAHPLLT